MLGNEQPGAFYTNDLKPASKDGAAYANILQRFLNIVRDLVGLGFYVILDCQLQQDQLSQACAALTLSLRMRRLAVCMHC